MTDAHYRLVIGNKAWSSWSLRPWLAMKRMGVVFEEINIHLRRPDSKTQILAHSPSGLVPTLLDGQLAIWDSLAILEYLAERHPQALLWPEAPAARATARSASAEMHSGFSALRKHCPMDLLEHAPHLTLPGEVEADIRRIVALWCDCRARFGSRGPFLFGRFSAADAMFAPVASRFRTYVADLGSYGDDGTAAAYVKTVFSMPEMDIWADGARLQLASAE